jgi:chitin synthase
MKRKDIQMAFREKVALNVIIYFMCAILLFYIGIFGRLICPEQQVLSSFELSGKTDVNDPWVSAYGRVYEIKEVVNNHKNAYGVQDYMFAAFLGKDVSNLFYKANLFPEYCPSLTQPQPGWDNLVSRPRSSNQNYAHQAIDPNTGRQKLYLEFMNKYARFRLAWTLDYIAQFASAERRLIVLYDNVYDVSGYFNSENPFFGPNVGQLFANFYGKDATKEWQKIVQTDPNASAYLNCMNNLFYIGTVDHRNDFSCQFSNYILLATSILLVTVSLYIHVPLCSYEYRF